MKKHGHCVGPRKSATYQAWTNMLARCNRPSTTPYKYYGGRGIKVCERWSGRNGFLNFLADLGSRPSDEHSLDRFPDLDGHYEPGNVRWATRLEQGRNKKRQKLTADIVNEIRGRAEHGESQSSIGRRFGITHSLAHAVIRRKMWAEVALVLLVLSSCRTCPPPIPPPPVVRVVPGDPHCLTVEPKRVDEVVGELNSLPKNDPGTREQVDRLAAAYLDAYKYSWRAYRACGSAPAPPALPGAGSGSGAP